MNNTRDRQVFEEIVLPNGIEIYYYPEKAPIALSSVIIPFGSAHNTGDILPGSAHFLEHMVLQRSKTFPDLKGFSKEVDSMGGYIGGATYDFETRYTLGVPKQHFAKAWEGFIDQIFNPVFVEEDIIKQASVIASEKSREKYYPAQSELGHYIFTKWAYDCPFSIEQLYGKKNSSCKITPNDLRKMHQNYFHSPLRILIGGDIDIKMVEKSLRQLKIKPHTLSTKYNPLKWVNRKYHECFFRDINRWEYRFGGIEETNFEVQIYAAIIFIHAYITNYHYGVLYKWLREQLAWSYEVDTMIYRRPNQLFWYIYIPLQDHAQTTVVRNELCGRIRESLQDEKTVLKKVDRQMGKASFYYQTIGEILNDAAGDLHLYRRIIPEKEWIELIKGCRDTNLLVKTWDNLVQVKKTGEFCAVPQFPAISEDDLIIDEKPPDSC